MLRADGFPSDEDTGMHSRDEMGNRILSELLGQHALLCLMGAVHEVHACESEGTGLCLRLAVSLWLFLAQILNRSFVTHSADISVPASFQFLWGAAVREKGYGLYFPELVDPAGDGSQHELESCPKCQVADGAGLNCVTKGNQLSTLNSDETVVSARKGRTWAPGTPTEALAPGLEGGSGLMQGCLSPAPCAPAHWSCSA